MRILMATDLEGAAGVETMESVHRGGPGFEEAYAELAKDINAALAGAFEGGADEVVVIDGHGPKGLDYSLIDPRAIRGDNARGGQDWLSDYKRPYDAMFCIGYHAMAGTQNAFLDHTQSSASWFEYKINGRLTGEIGQEGMWAAYQDAPVILATGDEALAAEAHNFFGDIECVAVKRAIGRNKCETYDKEMSRDKIRRAAKKAAEDFIRDPSRFKPYKPKLPAEMLLTFYRTDYADSAMEHNPSLERVGPRTVRKIITDYLGILP